MTNTGLIDLADEPLLSYNVIESYESRPEFQVLFVEVLVIEQLGNDLEQIIGG